MMKGERGRNEEQEQVELEDTFDGKINEGEEYVGQNEIRLRRRLQKGRSQYNICQCWWRDR